MSKIPGAGPAKGLVSLKGTILLNSLLLMKFSVAQPLEIENWLFMIRELELILN
jgi:hypothetical protein